VLNILDRIEEVLIASLMAAATLLIFVAVLHRYGTGVSFLYPYLIQIHLSWAQELCIYMFVWMAKFGAAYGVRTGIHVGVDVLVNQLSPTPRRYVVLFSLFCGALFTAVVGTFRDPNPFAPAGDFSASVDWGDGTSSGGTVQPVPSCCSGVMFSISGTHVYASAGPFTVRTAINDKGGTTDLLVGTAGGVAVTPSPISLRAGVGQGIGFDFGVAQFRSRLPCSDFNGPGYSATIAWGDGTSSHGGISNSGGCAGVFTLGDHHTYANGGANDAEGQELLAELSEPVTAALEEAVRVVESLLDELTTTHEKEVSGS